LVLGEEPAKGRDAMHCTVLLEIATLIVAIHSISGFSKISRCGVACRLSSLQLLDTSSSSSGKDIVHKKKSRLLNKAKDVTGKERVETVDVDIVAEVPVETYRLRRPPPPKAEPAPSKKKKLKGSVQSVVSESSAEKTLALERQPHVCVFQLSRGFL
jgi:hypothetical protein